MLSEIVAAASVATCPPLADADQIARNLMTRYVIVGEMHGTTQTPKVFGDLVCHLAKSGRPITVALEISNLDQPKIDAYMASDGGSLARTLFLKSDFWRSPFKDGRSSVAYLALFDRLRLLKAERAITGVAACQPFLAQAESETRFNAAMADLWMKARPPSSSGLLVALVGKVHARKKALRVGAMTIIPAAADLPRRLTINLTVPAAGRAWTCMSDTDCGAHQVIGQVGQMRKVILSTKDGSAYDGEVLLGEPSTASPPAVPAVAPVHQ